MEDIIEKVNREYKIVVNDTNKKMFVTEKCEMCNGRVISNESNIKNYKGRLICISCYYKVKKAERILGEFKKIKPKKFKVSKRRGF